MALFASLRSYTNRVIKNTIKIGCYDQVLFLVQMMFV